MMTAGAAQMHESWCNAHVAFSDGSPGVCDHIWRSPSGVIVELGASDVDRPVTLEVSGGPEGGVSPGEAREIAVRIIEAAGLAEGR